MAIITVTLNIDPNNPSQTIPSYSPSNRVMRGMDSVVFTVLGSTAVFTVNFPDGSPFGASINNIQVGGTTLAAQSTPPEAVPVQMPLRAYRFVATPNASSSPAPKPHPGEPDTPGTATGDLEVVPDTGGA